MSGMDDYFKSLEMMTDGVKGLATTLAVNDTTKKLHEAQANAKNDQERMAVNQQFGQDLALRLTGVGASPQQISAATEGLSASASVLAQQKGMMDVEKLKTQAEIEKERMKNETSIKTHQMSLDALSGKNSSKEKKELNAMADAFGKQPQTQGVLKGLSALDDALANFDVTKGGFGSTMAANLSKMGVLKSAVGRINDREFQAADETAAGRNQLWKKLVTNFGVTGEQPQDITQFWQKVVQAHKDKALEGLSKQAKGYAKSKASLNDKVDEDKLSSAIHSQYGLGGQKPNVGSAAISDALDFLSSEEGQKLPTEKKQQVLDKIKKMNGGQ